MSSMLTTTSNQINQDAKSRRVENDKIGMAFSRVWFGSNLSYPENAVLYQALYSIFKVRNSGLAIWSSGILRPFKSRLAKSKHSSAALQKTRPDTRQRTGKDGEPLAEYTATYSAEDTLFDLSFEIEKSTNYLGECGVTVAQKPGTDPTQATALEIWLFDARDTQTVSKILMSDFCYNDERLRSELEIKGQGLLIHPGKMIELETGELRAETSVLQVEYEIDAAIPKGVFKRVVIRITVWKVEAVSTGSAHRLRG